MYIIFKKYFYPVTSFTYYLEADVCWCEWGEWLRWGEVESAELSYSWDVRLDHTRSHCVDHHPEISEILTNNSDHVRWRILKALFYLLKQLRHWRWWYSCRVQWLWLFLLAGLFDWWWGVVQVQRWDCLCQLLCVRHWA